MALDANRRMEQSRREMGGFNAADLPDGGWEERRLLGDRPRGVWRAERMATYAGS